MNFLVRTKSLLPSDFPKDRRERLLAEERSRSKALSDSGKLVAHWKVPITGETVTLWDVSGAAELHELVMSLPAAAWARASVTPLIPRNLGQHAKAAASKSN